MVSCLTFKFLLHFEFIFVHGGRVCSSFTDVHAAVPVSQHHLLERLSFSHFVLLSCLLCQRLIDRRCLGLFLGSLFCSTGPSVLVPHCLDDCGFVILPEVWENYASFLFFVPQNCVGNSGSFVVPYKFLDCSSSVKNVMGNWIGTALNL